MQLNLATQVKGLLATASLADGANFLKKDGSVALTASLNAGNQTIQNLANGVNGTDAVNLTQVQALISGLSDKAEVQYCSTSPLPANTYANGAAGVGATLTGNVNGALSVDGVPSVAGQRVLIAGEAAPANNGIYTVTAAGGAGAVYVLTRAADMDTAAEFGTGVMIPVKIATGNTAGTSNDSKVFISAAASAFVVGTTAISFSLIGSTYAAGTGLALGGTTFSVTYGAAAGTAAQGNDARITGALQTTALGANIQTALGLALNAASGIAGLTAGGVLAAAQHPALTGDVTNAAGSLATTVNTTAGTGFLKYGKILMGEVPTGAINGANTTFVLANTPQNGAIGVFLNGLRCKLTTDYAIVGTTITMVAAPPAGDVVTADYVF